MLFPKNVRRMLGEEHGRFCARYERMVGDMQDLMVERGEDRDNESPIYFRRSPEMNLGVAQSKIHRIEALLTKLDVNTPAPTLLKKLIEECLDAANYLLFIAVLCSIVLTEEVEEWPEDSHLDNLMIGDYPQPSAKERSVIIGNSNVPGNNEALGDTGVYIGTRWNPPDAETVKDVVLGTASVGLTHEQLRPAWASAETEEYSTLSMAVKVKRLYSENVAPAEIAKRLDIRLAVVKDILKWYLGVES